METLQGAPQSDELQARKERTEKTISKIARALPEPGFLEEDREEVQESQEFFMARWDRLDVQLRLQNEMGHRSLDLTHAS